MSQQPIATMTVEEYCTVRSEDPLLEETRQVIGKTGFCFHNFPEQLGKTGQSEYQVMDFDFWGNGSVITLSANAVINFFPLFPPMTGEEDLYEKEERSWLRAEVMPKIRAWKEEFNPQALQRSFYRQFITLSVTKDRLGKLSALLSSTFGDYPRGQDQEIDNAFDALDDLMGTWGKDRSDFGEEGASTLLPWSTEWLRDEELKLRRG